MSSGPTSSLRWRWLVPVIAAVGLFYLTPIRSALDRAFFDAASRQPLRSIPPPDGAAIVLIDNRALDTLSQRGFGVTWPPPRAIFAALIAGLQRASLAFAAGEHHRLFRGMLVEELPEGLRRRLAQDGKLAAESGQPSE